MAPSSVLSRYSASASNSDHISCTQMDASDDAIFTACLDDVSGMSKILHELHSGQEHAILIIASEGVRVLTGDSNYQVSAFFPSSLFSTFKFNNQIHFRFTLKDFIEIINLNREEPGETIAAPDDQKTSLYIQYKKRGSPLTLKLENKSNMVISCQLNAFSTNNHLSPLQFDTSDDICCLTTRSKKIHDLIIGLDFTSQMIEITMGRHEYLKMTTSSELGESEMQISVEEIEAPSNCVFRNKYKSSYAKPALEASKNSNLIKMKCSSSGLLSVEHFHAPDDQLPALQYYILAQAIPLSVCDDEC